MPPVAKEKLRADEFAKRLGKSESIAMGKIFALAKEFIDTSPAEIEKLLDSKLHAMRVGAVSIMDWKARAKATSEAERKQLFDLYIRRHDRIDTWDLVDRSAPYVVGGYLAGRSRKILYKLARSANPCERRAAIVSTYFFIRQDDLNDTFGIAEILVNDKEEIVQKAVGSWVREAGKRDPPRLIKFLDKHAATMPRTVLRYAIEKLSRAQRQHYLGLKVK